MVDSRLNEQLDACERLQADLKARRRLFGGAESIEVPAGGLNFWQWLAEYVRPGCVVKIHESDEIPPYPKPERGQALWYSGGCESTYTLHQLANTKLDLLSIDSFQLFRSDHRAVGQIHFLCAAIAAALGYEIAYLGVERHDLLLTSMSGRYVERSPLFLDAWSDYLGGERVRSLCRELPKEQILEKIFRQGLRISGTCDNLKDGNWCGNCFKCFEAFYTAKSIGRRLPIELMPEAFDRYHAEYTAYVRSQFKDNYNNAQQYFLRLQVIYGITFEKDQDCVKRLLGSNDCHPFEHKK